MSRDRTRRSPSVLRRSPRAVESAILGQRAVVEDLLVVVLAGGHALLEGAPGLGKTRLVRALAHATDLTFGRVQFTPDLMPADVTGTTLLSEEHGRTHFTFQPGPVFHQVLLADEINRATPKTQSALLEAMQERSVTVSGEEHPSLPQPFTVLATQNPLEMEGTYPLPEAQLDRFLFKILVPRPDAATLTQILSATTGRIRNRSHAGHQPRGTFSVADHAPQRADCQPRLRVRRQPCRGDLTRTRSYGSARRRAARRRWS